MFKNKLHEKIVRSKPEFQTFLAETKIGSPIYAFDLKDEIDSSDIVEKVYRYKELFPESNKTYVKAWHSGFYTHRKTDYFDELIKVVEQKVSYLMHLRSRGAKAEVAQSWSIIYRKGDKTNWHNHFEPSYSAVYYAQVEENPSPLVFSTKTQIIPKENMLVCFPGYLEHYVPIMKNEGERISLAFNLNCSLRDDEQI